MLHTHARVNACADNVFIWHTRAYWVAILIYNIWTSVRVPIDQLITSWLFVDDYGLHAAPPARVQAQNTFIYSYGTFHTMHTWLIWSFNHCLSLSSWRWLLAAVSPKVQSCHVSGSISRPDRCPNNLRRESSQEARCDCHTEKNCNHKSRITSCYLYRLLEE